MSTARREYALALAALAAASGGLLAATGQDWATAAGGASGQQAAASGGALSADALSPLASALALAALAALAAVVATKGWARRAVGAAVALFGAATVADVWSGTRQQRLVLLAEREGIAGAASLALDPVWPWVAMACGAGLLLVGGLVFARGGAWPPLGSRYDSPGGASNAPEAGEDPAALWEALSRGTDPTQASAEPGPQQKSSELES